jgi:uncharacterized protein (TIGR00369 family)
VSDSEHFRKLERMYALAPINEFFKPTLRISEAAAEVEADVDPRFFHAADAVHGSVYFKMLDDAAFFAANSLVLDVFVLTASFTVYLTRPVSEGIIISKGTVVNRSKRLLLAEAQLFDARGREIGRGSGSFMKSEIPLTPDIGYA